MMMLLLSNYFRVHRLESTHMLGNFASLEASNVGVLN